MFNKEVAVQRDVLFEIADHLLKWREAMATFENTSYKFDAKKEVDFQMEKLNAAIETAQPIIEKLRREK